MSSFSTNRMHGQTVSKKGRGRGGGASKVDRADDYSRTDVVERVDMHNERFEKYYKAQNILPESEWDEFMEALRNPLPTTFRVAGSRQYADFTLNVAQNTHYQLLFSP